MFKCTYGLSGNYNRVAMLPESCPTVLEILTCLSSLKELTVTHGRTNPISRKASLKKYSIYFNSFFTHKILYLRPGVKPIVMYKEGIESLLASKHYKV